jgi:ATP-dependent Lhr-like helicase
MLAERGVVSARGWLGRAYGLAERDAAVLVGLIDAQQRASRVPGMGELLVEEWLEAEGWVYAFHAPLARAACEALGRALAARLGRRAGGDVGLAVADLGWSIRLAPESRLDEAELPGLIEPAGFEADVLEGVERGGMLAQRFRHAAATALMVLRNPEGGRVRVGGLDWVAQRLYPLVKAACPDHPLLREVRREVLEDLLDSRTALGWLEGSRPMVRLLRLEGPSPFAAAWIEAGGGESLAFESPESALRRLHARLQGARS